ncbi:MAG TPA: plastocyanin/azurin family copper-binding protein [Acetobacteraceae bacterium]|nr:plastocyanin/azurin family copper-binding protein [Acetobacteraceae bacterium]
MPRFATSLCAALIAAMPLVAHADAEVTITQHMFMPATIVIHPGEKVTWVNRDADVHNVTSDGNAKSFHTPLLDTGESASLTFATPGTFGYHCSIHPDMTGTIIVK